MLGKGHGGLYNASKKEERRKRKAKRRERSEKFIDIPQSRIAHLCPLVRSNNFFYSAYLGIPL